MQALAELDTRQVATADGSRSLSEWVAARLDVGIGLPRNLTRTMRRLQVRPDLASELSDGNTTFDRIEALARLNDDVGLMEWADIYRVGPEAAKEGTDRGRDRASIGRRPFPHDAALPRRVLVEAVGWSRRSFWRPGRQVLTEAADRLPEIEGVTTDSSWKRATALIETLVSGDPPTRKRNGLRGCDRRRCIQGTAGVVLEPGANVGREALQAILCDAVTEVTARDGAGRYMDYGRRFRTAPPALKRALLAETDFMCAADGCTSRRRLQVHHLKPWAEGGETNQADLVVLWWFHHQVVVNERRLEIVFHPDRRRVRFRRPDRGPPRSLGS